MNLTLSKNSVKRRATKRFRNTLIAAALVIIAPLAAIAPAAPAFAGDWGCATTIPNTTLVYGRPFPTTYTGYSFAKTQNFLCSTSHSGVDWDMVDQGTRTFPAWAVSQGTIQNGYDASCYGYWTRLLGPDGIFTLYAHLASTTKANGASVTKGTIIGWAGSTGGCPAPGATHLHVSQTASWGGTWHSTLVRMWDPRSFLDNHGVNWLANE